LAHAEPGSPRDLSDVAEFLSRQSRARRLNNGHAGRIAGSSARSKEGTRSSFFVFHPPGSRNDDSCKVAQELMRLRIGKVCSFGELPRFHIVDRCKAEANTLHGKKMKTIDGAPKLAPGRRLATDPDCGTAGGLHPCSRRKRQWRVSDIDCHLEPHKSDLTPIARCPSDTARGSAQLLTWSEFERRFRPGFARSPIDSRPDRRCADAGDPSFDQSALADALARHHKRLGPRSADRDDTDSVNCPTGARKVHDDFAALQAKQVMSRSLGSCTRAHGEHIDTAGDDSQNTPAVIERPRPTTVKRNALPLRRNRFFCHDSWESSFPYA
jgi:hypothetical protein